MARAQPELHPVRRRVFLGGAAAALGAVAFPPVVAGAALGSAERRAPSDRVTIAFIGPGRRGSQLVREFSGRPDAQPVAVCDVRRDQREKMRALADELARPRAVPGASQGCRTYHDFRDVLERPDIDGVVISAPEHWRGIMCIMAAKAAKDVFTEKPFALTIKEGQAMVAAVRRYGRIFQHCTQRRSNNEQKLRDSCELVRNGRIGKVLYARVTVGPAPRIDAPDYAARGEAPDPETFDWDMWLGPAPWRPYAGMDITRNWQQFRDFGLRSIGNWASHTLDMAQWALGKDAEGPVAIVPAGAGEEHLTITYADGVRIVCPRTEGDSAECSIHGAEGAKIIFDGPKIREKYDATPLGPNEVRLYRPARNDHNGNWLDGIRTRATTICNEEVGYRSGSLVLLIAISDILRRPLAYDPVKAEFPGDGEANRLLDTPKRAPWRAY